mgnify:CR=1 FL=1
MKSEVKFEKHNLPNYNEDKSRVKLTDLLSRLNEEKKKERNEGDQKQEDLAV